MNDSFMTPATKAGTYGGLLTILLVNIGTGEILRTVVLAAVGAAVSFSVSMLLKWIVRKLKRG